MTTIDPKQKIAPPPFLGTPAAAPPPPKPKALDQEYLPPGGPSGLGALFAPKPEPLVGPGVASEVVGKASPDLTKWSAAQLTQGIAKMAIAIKAHPGKVNDEDFALVRGMLNQLALRAADLPSTSVAPAKMSNTELFQTLLTFDVAKASGQKLSKEQTEYHAGLESAFKERAKVDPDKMLKDLEHQREELLGKSFMHCAAATAGAASVGLHMHAAGTVAGVGLMLHALHDKEYGHAFAEALVLFASRTPLGAVAEGASVLANVAECAAAAKEIDRIDVALRYYAKEAEKKPVSP